MGDGDKVGGGLNDAGLAVDQMHSDKGGAGVRERTVEVRGIEAPRRRER